MQEYLTYKRLYDRQYNTVYYSSKDDHYGLFSEYNERYAIKTHYTPKPSHKTAIKVSLSIIFCIIFVSATVTSVVYLIRKLKRRKTAIQLDRENSLKNGRKFKPVIIPSIGSKIKIVTKQMSVKDISSSAIPSMDITGLRDLEMQANNSVETEKAEHIKERSHLIIDNQDNSMIFAMKSARRLTDKSAEEPGKAIMSELSELNVSEEVDSFIF